MDSPLAFLDSLYSTPSSVLSPRPVDLTGDAFDFDSYLTGYDDHGEPYGQTSCPSTSLLSDISSFATGHMDLTDGNFYPSTMSHDTQPWTHGGLYSPDPIMSWSWEHLVSAPSPASSSSSIHTSYNTLENTAASYVSLSPLAVSLPITPTAPLSTSMASFTDGSTYPSPPQHSASSAYSSTPHLSDAEAYNQDTDGEADDEESSGNSGSEYAQSDDGYTASHSRHYSTRRLPINKAESRMHRRLSPASSDGPIRVARTTHTGRSRHSPYSTSSPRSSSSPSPSSQSSAPQPTLTFNKPRLEKVGPKSGHVLDPKPEACPFCGYSKSQDLKRHIDCHFNNVDNVCCGVPVERAAELGIPFNMADAREWNNVLRVGGCWKAFSRSDSLARHLRAPKTTCVRDTA